LSSIRIICHQSPFVIAQVHLLQQQIRMLLPDATVECILIEPNDEVAGTNEKKISAQQASLTAALKNGKADLAIHSMENVDAGYFLTHPAFAIVSQSDARSVAIFSNTAAQSIKEGKPIVVGSSFMANNEKVLAFLQKALPAWEANLQLAEKPIAGNIEQQLQQLTQGQYDAVIVPVAHVNALLQDFLQEKVLKPLLQQKPFMLLPLLECPPSAGQAAVGLEANPANKEMVALLKKINNQALLEMVTQEMKIAHTHNREYTAKVGVVALPTLSKNIFFAAGENSEGKKIQQWYGLPSIRPSKKQLFSSTDYMKDFFEYEWKPDPVSISTNYVFVANYKSVKTALQASLYNGATSNQKIMFAAGTRTWFQLAKKGYWISASADALGFENFLPTLQMPFFHLSSNDLCILTHEEAALRWQEKGYLATSNYKLLPQQQDGLKDAIGKANYLFWSSFSQYQLYQPYTMRTATHLCAGGETATLLKKEGLSPIIFPTIKSFEYWRQSLPL
jgi:porphobilinogen deaminase